MDCIKKYKKKNGKFNQIPQNIYFIFRYLPTGALSVEKFIDINIRLKEVINYKIMAIHKKLYVSLPFFMRENA